MKYVQEDEHQMNENIKMSMTKLICNFCLLIIKGLCLLQPVQSVDCHGSMRISDGEFFYSCAQMRLDTV